MTLAAAELDFNDQFRAAYDEMEDESRNVLVTGKAGTGKSTLLRYFRSHTTKQVAVTAPTGVAALNIGGQTIHSFFGFRPDITPEKVHAPAGDSPARKIDTLIIDEVSMVRADLLDCVDRAMRKARRVRNVPFGGVQLILIGDLYQIPPVVQREEEESFRTTYPTPYFYSAQAFQDLDITYVELEKIYRQRDPEFITVLNAIRNNTVTDDHLRLVNGRVDPAFEHHEDDLSVTLTPTNAAADTVNARRLDRLPGELHRFPGVRSGDFAAGALPVPDPLELKEEAQVMMANNDADGRWVNGSIGRIRAIGSRGGDRFLEVELTTGERVEVEPHEWELLRYTWDSGTGLVDTEVAGTFTQFPLRLAWALTIHKSQGKTFDRVILDLGRGAFASGQTYVALSRCTSLGGLTLRRPLRRQDILVDRRIVEFVTSFQYARAARKLSLDAKVAMIHEAIAGRVPLRITYLKATDERSVRTITPDFVGEMTHGGDTFVGLTGWCHERKSSRRFRLDRILDLAHDPD